MSQEKTNVEVLQKAYALWADTRGGSADDWMAICADDIRFGSIAQGHAKPASYLDSYEGKTALRDYFAGLSRDWEMMDWTVEHMTAQDDRVAVMITCIWRFKKTSKVIMTPMAHFWRMRDGKAVEYFEFFDTAKLHAVVGSDVAAALA